MSSEFSVKLLLLLAIFCLEDVFGRGRTTAFCVESTKLQGRRSLSHDKAKSSGRFNVKSFGAVADGRTDDSNVCELVSILLCAS